MLKKLINRLKQWESRRRLVICKAILGAIQDITKRGEEPTDDSIIHELRARGIKVSPEMFDFHYISTLRDAGFVSCAIIPDGHDVKRAYSLTAKAMLVMQGAAPKNK